MARIIEFPKEKIAKCKTCEATIAYLPEDITTESWRDLYGDPSGVERVKCPRVNCAGGAIVRAW